MAAPPPPSRIALCDVRSASADLVTIEALARLQLAAQRRGRRVALCNASPELLELVELIGLTDVLAENY